MAALLDLHPDTADAVSTGLADLHAVIDRLHTAPTSSTRPGAAVTEVDRAIRRLESLKLKVVAAAAKAGAAQDAGFTGPDAWLAKNTSVSRADAARQVALAKDLDTGHDTTATALEEGLVSPGHAAVIVNAAGQLPAGVSAEQRQEVEASLIAKASQYSPEQLRRIAHRAIEAVEPDQVVVDAHENDLIRTEEQAAQDKCTLTMHDNADGTTTGHFTVPTLAAAILAKIIDTITAPRRMRPPGSCNQAATPGAAGQGAAGQDRSFDWRHRRGLAFAELLEHLPTDHLHPRSAATVIVTIDHTVLAGALKAAHLDTDQHLSAGEARRLACNAAILPAVLGRRSVALDLGYASRLFSEGQRIAKGLEYDTCAAAGCERPYAWCELHHWKPWIYGGKTDLANAIPLCHQHHQWVHDTAFNHQAMPDGSVRFSRRT